MSTVTCDRCEETVPERACWSIRENGQHVRWECMKKCAKTKTLEKAKVTAHDDDFEQVFGVDPRELSKNETQYRDAHTHYTHAPTGRTFKQRFLHHGGLWTEM